MHEISWPINKFCDFIPTSNWHISCHNQLMKFVTFSMIDWLTNFAIFVQRPIVKICDFLFNDQLTKFITFLNDQLIKFTLLQLITKFLIIFYCDQLPKFSRFFSWAIDKVFNFFYVVLVNFPLLTCLFILIYLLIYFILSPYILFLAIPIYLNIKLAFYLFTC